MVLRQVPLVAHHHRGPRSSGVLWGGGGGGSGGVELARGPGGPRSSGVLKIKGCEGFYNLNLHNFLKIHSHRGVSLINQYMYTAP
jgi:hypothetical protein